MQQTGPVTFAFYRDARTAWIEPLSGLLTLSNDREVSRRINFAMPILNADLPFHDGPGDAYRVVASVAGHYDCGGFIHVDAKVHGTVSLLLVPRNPTLHFPLWEDLLTRFSEVAHLITSGVDQAEAEQRYIALAAQKPLALASLMNLTAALQLLGLGHEDTLLTFIKALIWDDTLAQDRFFAYADPAILPLVRAAAAEHEFAEEPNSHLFHPGATASYKQTEFDYANVQITFHACDTKWIDGKECIKIEFDMDLFRELLAHGVDEVIPNLSTHNLTNPLDVLALRWIDAVQSDQPLFDPGYTFA